MKKRMITAYIIAIAGSLGAAALFQLSLAGAGILCVVSGLLIPFFEKNRNRELAQTKEYQEVSLYMEQLLCSYKRWGTLGGAWEDCVLLFEKGSEMRQAVEQAVNCLRTGEQIMENNIAWSACQCIHGRYDSYRLVLIHEFLCRSEQMGGDTGEAFDILLNDLQLWKRRKSLFRTQKKILKMESILSVILAGSMCCFSRLIMPFDLEKRLLSSTWYQISTIMVISLLMVTLLLIFQKLTGNWLDFREKNNRMDKEQEKQYRILKSSQHGIKWQIARKYCRQQAEQEFPYWLLSVTLYLQQDNVYQAICNSLGQFHGMFRKELKQLIKGIYSEPASLLPYMDFFKELEMEEIQTGMKILYSTGNSEYQDVRRQVHFLVEQNSLTMDKYEQHRQELQTSGMGILKQIPLMIAAGKIIIDMAIVLIATMEHYAVWQ